MPRAQGIWAGFLLKGSRFIGTYLSTHVHTRGKTAGYSLVIMPIIIWITLFALLEALMSLLGGLLFVWKESFARKISLELINFAIGALLAVIFLNLLPESFASGVEPTLLFSSVLGGFLVFFIIERSILWYHCHHPEHETSRRYTTLITLADGVHNFLDGLVLGASFLVSIPVGIATTAAIVLHEIPQEISDFSIMLHGGLKRNTIILYNFLASLATVLGALLAAMLAKSFETSLPLVIAGTAGGLLYITAADIIPETHRDPNHKHLVFHTLLNLLGLGVIVALGLILPEA